MIKRVVLLPLLFINNGLARVLQRVRPLHLQHLLFALGRVVPLVFRAVDLLVDVFEALELAVGGLDFLVVAGLVELV